MTRCEARRPVLYQPLWCRHSNLVMAIPASLTGTLAGTHGHRLKGKCVPMLNLLRKCLSLLSAGGATENPAFWTLAVGGRSPLKVQIHAKHRRTGLCEEGILRLDADSCSGL